MIKRLYYIILQRLYVFLNKNKPNQGKVYMFHNVDETNDIYSITKNDFESFLMWLLENKKIVDVETLIKERNKDNVVITFDDVYASVYKNAYPILKKYKVPYYTFVNNDLLNKDDYVTNKMVREMLNKSGCILGSHNLKHELSRFKDIELFKKEIKESKKKLEKTFDVEVKDFAFPYGSMYACSKENISEASKLYKNVYMTYALPYNKDYVNIIPRININSKNYRREMN